MNDKHRKTQEQNRKSTQTIMGTCSRLLMLLVCLVNVKVVHSEDYLNYVYHSDYDLKWNDKGTGSDTDVSIWVPTVERAEFYPLGDTAVLGYKKPFYDAILVKDDGKGLVKPPLGFKEVWNDRGSGGNTDVTLYKMLPQPGYICLGDVAVAGYSTKPDTNAYRCVKSDRVKEGQLTQIWIDKGSGSNADVSLWNVDEETFDSSGIPPHTFISTNGYNKPTEQPYVLRRDWLNMAE